MIFLKNVQVAQWQSVRLKTSRSLVQIQSWTKVAGFIIFNLFIVLIAEVINSISILIFEIIFFNYFFQFIFIFLFLINFLIFKNSEKFNFNLDLITKYYLFFFKFFSIFLNLISIRLKQIFIFLRYFKYVFKLKTISIIFSNLYNILNLT